MAVYTHISVLHMGTHRDSPLPPIITYCMLWLYSQPEIYLVRDFFCACSSLTIFRKSVCTCMSKMYVMIPVSSSCRLLMDYPFIKQVSGNYRAHISSLTGRDSERQISANTVRILLLEEQNTELREKNIIPKTQSSEGPPYQVCN